MIRYHFLSTQKCWHTNCIMLKIQLLPLDENDCFACFKYFSEKIGFVVLS